MQPTSSDSVLADILAAVKLDEVDRARLVELGVKVAAQLPEIAQRFYERLIAHPGTASLLRDPAQVLRLRTSLIDWISSGLRGPYDEAFYEKRSRIGRRHVEIHLPQHYMFTAMNMLRGEYHDRIDALYDQIDARLVARSVDKLLDVELALMLHHYQHDLDARLVARERNAQVDRVTAIQTLSAGLAHEVRNPLNAAKLQLEVLERRLRRDGDDPHLVEPIAVVHHELERLTRMLNEFLAFARPSELRFGDCDVASLAHDVVASERPIAEARGAQLEHAGSGPLLARVDSNKLRLIMQNLLRNAVEAVAPGGRVTLTISASPETVHIAIADDGPGIPEAIQHRIFEPFFTTKDSGTGLGMSIVHSMVTAHGGAIAVESSRRGTRIEVTIPRDAPTGRPV